MSVIQKSTQFSQKLAATLAPALGLNSTLHISMMGDMVISLHHQKKRPTRYTVTPLYNATGDFTGARLTTLCNETRGKKRHISMNETVKAVHMNALEHVLIDLIQQDSDGIESDTQTNYEPIGLFYKKSTDAQAA